MCGEQSAELVFTFTDTGSPPRVRGPVLCVYELPCNRGITPACAGNRPECNWTGRKIKDHPRVCGEQELCSKSNRDKKGSPPRVRGTGNGCKAASIRQRITPACAGNSQSLLDRKYTQQDHPRVCGEQSPFILSRDFYIGSPPRVRGTEPTYRLLESLPRITPACAGNRVLDFPEE